MEDLSEAADVAVGSIYAHFGGKEGVYSALVDRALALDQRYSEEGFAGGDGPLERLVGMGEGYLRFAREHPAYFRLFRFPPPDRPSAEEAPGPAARIAERIRAEVARMAGLLREAAEEGVIRPVDPEPMARFMWAAWTGSSRRTSGRPTWISPTPSSSECSIRLASRWSAACCRPEDVPFDVLLRLCPARAAHSAARLVLTAIAAGGRGGEIGHGRQIRRPATSHAAEDECIAGDADLQ